MARILAFCSFDSFINNDVNVTNTVGELSNYAATYEKDVPSYPSGPTTLHQFRMEDIAPAEEPLISTVMEAVASEMPGLETAYVGGGDLELLTDSALSVNIIVRSVGGAVLNPADGEMYPEWIDITYTGEAGTWDIKIWLVDTSFRSQYTFCEITVVPPIPLVNIDSIINNFPQAQSLITSLSAVDLMDNMNAQIEPLSYTKASALELRIFNPSTPSIFYDGTWMYVLNGNVDLVTEVEVSAAIADQILGASDYNLNEWLPYIPGFEPYNKYFIVPTWNNVSLDNPSLSSPILSPTISQGNFNGIINTYFPDETDVPGASVALQYSVSLFKSTGFFALADISNPEGRLKWKDKFPDWMVIDVNNIVLSQLQVTTRAAIQNLDLLLRLCDTYQIGDTLDPEYELYIDNGGRWISRKGVGTQLFVLTRRQ